MPDVTIWRTVPEAPVYSVNNRGDIRNRRTGRILRPTSNGRGGLKVNLRDAGQTITRSPEALRKQVFG